MNNTKYPDTVCDFLPDPAKSFTRGESCYMYEGKRVGVASFDTPKAVGEAVITVRTYNGKTLKVYVNRNADIWEIPSGKILLGYNLQVVAPDYLTLGPRGFCIVEE